MKIIWTLVANPLGSFSVAGAQMKVTARERPTLTCSACGQRIDGTVNGRHAEFTPPANADADHGDPPLTRLHPDHTATVDNDHSTGHRGPDIGGDATPSA